jgi:coatomer subunit beta
VRRNAILAIYAIHKNLDYLIPDAPELIMEHIMKESDQSCRRNAFIMLSNANPVMASQYLMSVWPQLQNFEELMQLAVIEFIRKDFKSQTADKAKYIHAVISMLQSPSHSVKYEAATSLVSLTSHSSAMKGNFVKIFIL